MKYNPVLVEFVRAGSIEEILRVIRLFNQRVAGAIPAGLTRYFPTVVFASLQDYRNFCSPVAFMANVHLGAALASLMAVEHHALDIPWWTDIVTGIAPGYLADGYVAVPEAPGHGIDLNEDVIREHLVPWSGYFEPTDEWKAERVGFLGHVAW